MKFSTALPAPRAVLFLFAWPFSALHSPGQELGASPAQPPLATPKGSPQTAQSPAQPQVPTSPSGAPGNQPTNFWTQDTSTGTWGGFRDELKKKGITFTPEWTGEVMGNPSGGARQGVIEDGVFDLILSMDLDALTNGALKDTLFQASALYTYGNNLSAKYVHDFSITSNIATYNSLRLDELWVQKSFWDKKFSLKVGNIAVDNEFFTSSSAALFMSGTFGSFTLIANNVPNPPVYPLASPGVRLQLAPDPHFYLLAGVFGMDNNSDPATSNRNGTHFAFNSDSGMLVMSEIGYLLNQAPNEKGLQGSYRVGSWVDTGNYDTFSSQGEAANGRGNRQSAGPDYGIYGVIDQQIYSHDVRIVSFFLRSGGAPSNTSFVDYYVDSGFDLTGFVPRRASDVIGLGVARSRVSPDYSASQVAQGNPPSTAETVIEATYKLQLAPWWYMQPDAQYIITPSGVDGSRNAVVLGLRADVSF